MANGVDKTIADVGIVYNALVVIANTNPNPPDESDGGWPNFFYYGNWCGYGNKGKLPIDILDQFCMIHDGCYLKYGRNNQSCDEIFIRNLKNSLSRIAKEGKHPDASSFARRAIKFFEWKVKYWSE